MLVSQGHLRPRVKPERRSSAPAMTRADISASELDLHGAPAGVDTSPLFSFELFQRLEAQVHAA
jgi:hypothetical protein